MMYAHYAITFGPVMLHVDVEILVAACSMCTTLLGSEAGHIPGTSGELSLS